MFYLETSDTNLKHCFAVGKPQHNGTFLAMGMFHCNTELTILYKQINSVCVYIGEVGNILSAAWAPLSHCQSIVFVQAGRNCYRQLVSPSC